MASLGWTPYQEERARTRSSSTPSTGKPKAAQGRGRDARKAGSATRYSSAPRVSRRDTKGGSAAPLSQVNKDFSFSDWIFPDLLAAKASPEKKQGLCLKRAPTPTRNGQRQPPKEPGLRSMGFPTGWLSDHRCQYAERFAAEAKTRQDADDADVPRAEVELLAAKAEARRLVEAKAREEADAAAAARMQEEQVAARMKAWEEAELAKAEAQRLAAEAQARQEESVAKALAEAEAIAVAKAEAERHAAEEQARQEKAAAQAETDRLAAEAKAIAETEAAALAEAEVERLAAEELARVQAAIAPIAEAAQIPCEELSSPCKEGTATCEEDEPSSPSSESAAPSEEPVSPSAEDAGTPCRARSRSSSFFRTSGAKPSLTRVQKRASRADDYIDRVTSDKEVKRINGCKTAAAILLEDTDSTDPQILASTYLLKALLVHPLRLPHDGTDPEMAFARLTAAYRHYSEGAQYTHALQAPLDKTLDFDTFKQTAENAIEAGGLDPEVCTSCQTLLSRQ